MEKKVIKMVLTNPNLYIIYWESKVENKKGITIICAQDRIHAGRIFYDLPKTIRPRESEIINIQPFCLTNWCFLYQLSFSGNIKLDIPKQVII